MLSRARTTACVRGCAPPVFRGSGFKVSGFGVWVEKKEGRCLEGPWLCTCRALPAETKVERGTSQSRSGTSLYRSNSGVQIFDLVALSRSLSHSLAPSASRYESLRL